MRTEVINGSLVVKKDKSSRRKALKKLLAVLIVAAVIAAADCIANFVFYNIELSAARSTPENVSKGYAAELSSDGSYTLVADGSISILVLSDLRIGGSWLTYSSDTKTINKVVASVQAAQPDLIVLTGDNAESSLLKTATVFNDRAHKIVINLFNAIGVRWTTVFGDSDTGFLCTYGLDKVSELYAKNKDDSTLFSADSSEADGHANQVIRIRNSAGLITQSLYLLDYCSDSSLGSKPDGLHQNQIDWYSSKVYIDRNSNLTALKNLNSLDAQKYSSLGSPKSLLFTHMPINEYAVCMSELLGSGYSGTEDSVYNYGEIDKGSPYSTGAGLSYGAFEQITSLGSTQAVFAGHDTENDVCMTYKGVILSCNHSDSVRCGVSVTLSPEGNVAVSAVSATSNISADVSGEYS